eukprot:TRINITY_DN19347_c0_g1_i1.p1 TRINITY_DN19347_c0_g1~~TRINITY_DN19347_c0_g1_i1.p1  ORF type:complete len:518 (-),score=92.40 TRINITY_DN19347_c0_g1_i1:572-2125(-)
MASLYCPATRTDSEKRLSHTQMWHAISPRFLVLIVLICMSTHVSAFGKEPSKKATAVFLEWLEKNGVTQLSGAHKRVSIFTPPGASADERALLSGVQFSAWEKVVSIPYSLALVLEEDDPAPFVGATWQVRLAAKLLREVKKGEASHLKPYLDLFPMDVTIPWLDLKPEEFGEIQIEATMRRVADLQFQAQDDWAQCKASLIGEATWPMFGWAMTMVWNNALELLVPLEEGSNEEEWKAMFVPIFDMVSHNPEPNVYWLEDGVHHDRLDLITTKPIPQSQPLLADWGEYTPEGMFLFHGFIPNNNIRDQAIVFYNIHDAVEWYLRRYHDRFSKRSASEEITKEELASFIDAGKEGALRQLKIDGRLTPASTLETTYVDPHDETHGNAFVVHPNGTIDARLSGAFAQVARTVRNVHWFPDELEWQEEVEETLPAVIERVKEMLKSYETTSQEDRNLLRKERRKEELECPDTGHLADCKVVGGLSPAVKLAIRFRIMKKQLLDSFLKSRVMDGYGHDEL